mmetsp:Transcript_2345/g.5086  ORF Transcript_2345/g.5086 Transcript_2345/m.5086 type:complete len:237 (+) Transcript_2345:393-1103(+)
MPSVQFHSAAYALIIAGSVQMTQAHERLPWSNAPQGQYVTSRGFVTDDDVSLTRVAVPDLPLKDVQHPRILAGPLREETGRDGQERLGRFHDRRHRAQVSVDGYVRSLRRQGEPLVLLVAARKARRRRRGVSAPVGAVDLVLVVVGVVVPGQVNVGAVQRRTCAKVQGRVGSLELHLPADVHEGVARGRGGDGGHGSLSSSSSSLGAAVAAAVAVVVSASLLAIGESAAGVAVGAR